MTTTTGIIIASLLTAAYLYFFTAAPVLGIVVGAGGIVAGICAYNSLMAKAKSMCGSNCVCLQKAVSYLGWQGSCHMFEIVSSGYALAFMMANQSKLVNVKPEVWQWLQANGYNISPHQPQSAKRQMS